MEIVLDEEAVSRIVMCVTGLAATWFGNSMPKRLVPYTFMQRVMRVGRVDSVKWARLCCTLAGRIDPVRL